MSKNLAENCLKIVKLFLNFAAKTDEMIDLSEFESISPYTDEEAVKALNIVAENPVLKEVSQYFFPAESLSTSRIC